MQLHDPDSPAQRSKPCFGYPECEGHDLGDTDCDGVLVGWIQEDGHAWKSIRERDTATCAGRFHDAVLPWTRSGGLLGELPDVREHCEKHCLNPDSIEEAIRDCLEEINPENPFNRAVAAYRARAAELN